MKTNIYRCIEPCSNCPFLDNEDAIILSEGRLDEIKAGLDAGGSFNCHKTVYDEPIRLTIGLRMCHGAYEYLKAKGKPNQVMQVALRMGVENE